MEKIKKYYVYRTAGITTVLVARCNTIETAQQAIKDFTNGKGTWADMNGTVWNFYIEEETEKVVRRIEQ